MKFLRQTLLAALLGIGFALTVSAQQPTPEKREKPPKERVEIPPAEKKPPKSNDNPKNNDGRERPRKPQSFFLISENRVEITSV